MNKSDLKTGMKIVLGNGDELLVFKDYDHTYSAYLGYKPSNFVAIEFVDESTACWEDIELFYNDDLTYYDGNVSNRIDAVYGSIHPTSIAFPKEATYWKLLWERKDE